MKILNLYAGIGGNRKLWGDEHEITAIENNPEIAKIYQDNFPNDKVIVSDAHQYLLKHYKEFDFIWSSPPCPTHSKLRKSFIGTNCGANPVYPDMKLYEEILFLQGYFKGKWVVENVNSWYSPLIKPYVLLRHYFWSNFVLLNKKIKDGKINITGGYHKETDKVQIERLEKEFGFDLSSYKIDKRLLLRNCVNPKLAAHIFNMAFKEQQEVLTINDTSSSKLKETIKQSVAQDRN